MDNLDNFRERFDALEQQTGQLMHHTRTITRRLRWWRGLACGLVVLGLLTWALPVVTADDGKKDLEQRVAALEKLLDSLRRLVIRQRPDRGPRRASRPSTHA